MTMPDDSQNDPLDAAFGFLDIKSTDNNLRGAVLAQTLGVVRRRRRMKRCAFAAGLLGCYLAGITTMGLLWSNANASNSSQADQSMTAEQSPQNVIPSSSAPAIPEKSQSSAKLSGFESWRRFGDNYLRETGDISLAVAGYSNAINRATDEELTSSSGQDNWILKALKNERIKERNHACSDQN
jgi:hypothetical protein